MESQQINEEIELDELKSEVPVIPIGDTGKVGVLPQEGNMESQQISEKTELDQVKSEEPAPNKIKIKRKQIVEKIELDQLIELDELKLKFEVPVISIGDTVKVGVLIQEGNKQRVQPYEGTVIAQHRAGMNSTITVRRIFQGVGVERVFTLHSPSLKNIEITRRAKVRKAKLYYLRDRVGKATRLKQKNIINN
uniref:Large ribosomal subunit protein bL19c n=1 Tax=Trebouxia aggregata TaxID=160068 RepID=G8XPD8_9CHLO|nr:ribosomal protein L19 [Trebouxia aggregata]